MSLLDSIKSEKEKVVEATNASAAPVTVGKKKSNSDYQKRQREHQFKAACTVRDFIKGTGVSIPEDVQNELDFLCKEKKAGAVKSSFGKPVIYKLFGNAPKVGDSITALKVFEETGKGFAEMRGLMKKWSEKQNIKVVYDEGTKSYKITEGSIAPYTEA